MRTREGERGRERGEREREVPSKEELSTMQCGQHNTC